MIFRHCGFAHSLREQGAWIKPNSCSLGRIYSKLRTSDYHILSVPRRQSLVGGTLSLRRLRSTSGYAAHLFGRQQHLGRCGARTKFVLRFYREAAGKPSHFSGGHQKPDTLIWFTGLRVWSDGLPERHAPLWTGHQHLVRCTSCLFLRLVGNWVLL